MYQKIKQSGRNPFPGISNFIPIKGIIGSGFLLSVFLFLFALRAPAQSTPVFSKYGELKYPNYNPLGDVFEGYGMLIHLEYKRKVETYRQDLKNGLLGEVSIRPSDEAINAGKKYIVVVSRFYSKNACSQKESIFNREVEGFLKEFDIYKTGGGAFSTSLGISYKEDHSSQYLDFKCQKFMGDFGQNYNSGELCVACKNDDLFIMSLLNKEKYQGLDYVEVRIEFAKFKGFW